MKRWQLSVKNFRMRNKWKKTQTSVKRKCTMYIRWNVISLSNAHTPTHMYWLLCKRNIFSALRFYFNKFLLLVIINYIAFAFIAITLATAQHSTEQHKNTHTHTISNKILRCGISKIGTILFILSSYECHTFKKTLRICIF